MKKIFSFAAICALLVSCGGNNNADVVVDNPQGDNAGQVAFNTNNPNLNAGGKDLQLNNIQHFGNGHYMGEGIPVGGAMSPTKGSLVQKITGRYTAADLKYEYLDGDLAGCTLILDKDNVFKFKNRNGNESSGNSTFTPAVTPTDIKLKALTGAHWKLSSIEAKVKGKNLKLKINGVGNSPDPNNVEKVAKYLNENGANIPLDKVTGYVIKSISLNVSPVNSIIVEFENGMKSIEGSWNPDTKNMTFSYVLNANLDGKLFDAEATGAFSFEDNYNTLVVNVDAKAASDMAEITIKAKKIQ